MYILVELRNGAQFVGTGLLINAAQRLLAGQDPSPPMNSFVNENQSLPFEIDTSAGAVAIGDGGGAIATLEKLIPENSNAFIVRAYINATSVGEIRKLLGDRKLGDLKFYSDPPIAKLLTCGKSRYVKGTADVQSKLEAQRLWNKGLDGSRVAIAIVDTGISLKRLQRPLGELTDIATPATSIQYSWTPPTVTSEPFKHRVGHGTMCAYDALIAAPKATLLDVAMLLFRPYADHTVPSTVFAALAAYSFLANLWQTWLAMGASSPFQALVVNNSWGIFHPFLDPFLPGDQNRFIDNPDHALRKYFVIPMIDKGVDIIFASNNCGPECTSATCLGSSDGMIMAMNAYEEVLTVGGCDVNRDRVGYSSMGPSIIGMKTPTTGTDKPDITAYTHFLGSKTRQVWLPDAGVSAACAVASGCVAALRSGKPSPATSTATMFQALRDKALKGNSSGTGGGGGTYSTDYGCGIINPVEAGIRLGLSIP